MNGLKLKGMIEPKKNKCRGSGKAKGHGCNNLVFKRTYGLCNDCLRDWAYNTDKGHEYLAKTSLRQVRKDKKEENQKERQVKRESNEKKAMQLADTYFSRYIRLKHSVDGQCTCYTCGTIKDIKEVDNGHYMKRAHKATRYHENNCKPQCKVCNGNTLHNGKQVEFRINLINEIGLNEVESIEFNSKQSINANYFWYKDISDYYRNKVNELQKELGVKYW